MHPTTEYARRNFGLAYTQDESYYMLDAEPDASVFLGMRDGVTAAALLEAIAHANTGHPFDAAKFVRRWPAKKHDHFLLPAGTIHCSGAGAMVLEISATPYIFTFKLWDWGRLGLDGMPRPINLGHGRGVLRTDLSEAESAATLINNVSPCAEGPGWLEERTGLHSSQFIETRRHWFTSVVTHNTQGNLNVLNLIQGDEAVVESPHGAFEPFTVHYAETFIVPAAVGAYSIQPTDKYQAHKPEPFGTIKAFVRP